MLKREKMCFDICDIYYGICINIKVFVLYGIMSWYVKIIIIRLRMQVLYLLLFFFWLCLCSRIEKKIKRGEGSQN